jgi:hypothetical protein
MTQMVRTQVYIQKRQRAALKRLARARGVSEAELIRQAIDQQLSSNVQPTSSDPKAWEKAHQFMLALHARGPIPNRPRMWKRDDLYEERLSRYDHSSD